MKLNVIAPNLDHIPADHWNSRLKKFNVDLDVIYGYPEKKDDLLLITDTAVYNWDESYTNTSLWIIESPLILEHFSNGFFEKIYCEKDKFTKIYTHDRCLIEKSNKFVFKSHGDCSIENYQDLKKSKLLSMISSDKRWIVGHDFRHRIIEKYRNKFDLYGRGFNVIEHKEIGLNEYMFSIAVENCKKDYYFTEKLIDCFRTKTIPLYWGCPSISKFFDENGIIQFDNIDELGDVINSLTEETYYSLIQSVENNYNLSFEYDTFFTNLDLS